MGRPRQGVDEQASVSPEDDALLKRACPDLNEWPQRWLCEDADLVPGATIVASFKPFLLDLLHDKTSKTTFNRHRDNLWQVGGELIRRRYEDPQLKRLPIDQLIRQLIEEDGGPLISPAATQIPPPVATSKSST